MKKKNAQGRYIWAWKHKQIKVIGLINVCFEGDMSKNDFFTTIYFSACLGAYPKRQLGDSKGTLGNHLLP